MNHLPPNIRAVFFDAVGTLLHPEPSAADAYADIGARFGSRLTRDVITTRFRTAFRRQEKLDHTAGHRTCEEREVMRWRAIVNEVLDDVTDAEGCFRVLYDHFARRDSWRVEPDAPVTLQTLAKRGLTLGICSNFDHRLRKLVEEMPELAPVRHLVISSLVGWKKPAAGFFAEVARFVSLSPKQILIVGDDLVNDFEGAQAAGFPALLLDPHGKSGVAPQGRITRLGDLLN